MGARMIGFIFFLQISIIFSAKYEIIEKDVLQSYKTIQGVENISNSKVSIFIKDGDILTFDSKNNLVSTVNNPINIPFFSGENVNEILIFKLYGYDEQKNIMAFTEDCLLCFYNKDYSVITSSIVGYDGDSQNPVDKDKLTGNTILEIFEDKLLLAFGVFDEPNSIYNGEMRLFKINKSTNTFTQTNRWEYPEVYDNENASYFIACKFLELGMTIFCGRVDNDLFMKIGLVNDALTGFETEQTVHDGFMISGLKSLKMSENRICFITFDLETPTNLYFDCYEVKNRQYQISGTYEMTDMDSLITETFSVAKGNDDHTIFLLFVDQLSKAKDAKIHIVSLFEQNVNDVSIKLFDTEKTVTEQAFIASFQNSLITFFSDSKSKKVKSYFLLNIPQCEDLSFNLFSGEFLTISLQKLSPLDANDVIVNIQGQSSGSLDTSSNKEIRYTAITNGKDTIYYYLSAEADNNFKSKTCRIKIQVCNPACSSCQEYSEDVNNPKCTGCGNGFSPLEDDSSICASETEEKKGYFFDNSSNTFKKCHSSCETCNGAGSDSAPNCKTCPKDLILSSSKKCLCDTTKSPWYTKNGDPVCVTACPTNYPLIITSTKECVANCPSSGNNLKYLNSCVDQCPTGTKQKQNECEVTTMEEIISNIDNNVLQLSKDQPTASFSNSTQQSTYQIYDTSEEGKAGASKMSNVSTIDLGECETLLKEKNGIPESESLLIFKLDIAREGQISNQVEYSVYAKNGTKLDLSICSEVKISVSSPLHITDEKKDEINFLTAERLADLGYDMYNSEDPFYTDVCTPYTTDDDTDIPLEDRKKDVYKNVSFCETGCEYKEINLTTQKVLCECNIKTEVVEESKGFSMNSLGDSFKTVISSSNLKVVKCTNLVFRGKQLLKNIGSWIIIGIAFIEFILIFTYIGIGVKPVVNIINRILGKISLPQSVDISPTNGIIRKEGTKKNFQSFSLTPAAAPPKKEKRKKHKKEKEEEKEKNIVEYNFDQNKDFEVNISPVVRETEENENKETAQDIDERISSPKRLKSPKRKKKHYHQTKKDTKYFDDDSKSNDSTPIDRVTSIKFKSRNNVYVSNPDKELNTSVQSRLSKASKDQKETLARDSQTQLKESTIIRYSKMDSGKFVPDSNQSAKVETRVSDVELVQLRFSDEELNEMAYNDAIVYDKRKFCRYYYSILKYDQLIIFTFITDTDFNLKVLKIAMFLFGFAMYLTFNALFYTDSSMSHNYHNKGTFDFIYSLPKTIFSSVACAVINFLLKFLSLSQSKIKKIKEEKDPIKAKQMSNSFINCLKVKIAVFFILLILFLALFWYYNTAFCMVYVNTQKHLVKDTLMSFIMSMLYPFAICFVTAIFRICSLRKKSKCLYGFSKILQLF